jgi:hypothetical protein
MRIICPRVAAAVVLAAFATLALGGCELREGDPSEYGNSSVYGVDISTVPNLQLLS